jgi:hypothetical protein
MTFYHIKLCPGGSIQELLPQNSHAKKYCHVHKQVPFSEKTQTYNKHCEEWRFMKRFTDNLYTAHRERQERNTFQRGATITGLSELLSRVIASWSQTRRKEAKHWGVVLEWGKEHVSVGSSQGGAKGTKWDVPEENKLFSTCPIKIE